jgi:hypothetical protein
MLDTEPCEAAHDRMEAAHDKMEAAHDKMSVLDYQRDNAQFGGGQNLTESMCK